MAKLHCLNFSTMASHCPGCGNAHYVKINDQHDQSGGAWGWNGSMDSPTFTPSVLTWGGYPERRCHSFVTDGKIRFLNDCTHPLKGQTIEIPEWEGLSD